METEPEPLPEELQDVLARAHKGDASSLPALRKALREHPELAVQFGTCARHATDALLKFVGGSSLLVQEAVREQMRTLLSSMHETAKTQLELLLVDRVVLCNVEVAHMQTHFSNQLASSNPSEASIRTLEKRLDKAHARFIAAVKALGMIQKLRPARTLLDMLGKNVGRPKRTKKPESAAGHESRFTMPEEVPVGVG